MYLAGVSTRQVDDISKLLWGDRMPSQTLSDKLKRVYDDIDRWRTRPLESEYPYVFMDGVWHKRSWGGSVEKRQRPRRHRRQRGGPPRGHRRDGGHEGGRCQLGAVHTKHDRTRFEGRAPRGRRPVRGTRLHGELDASPGEVPAVHGALHAQRALEGAAQPPGLGVRGPEGDIRHGVPRIRLAKAGTVAAEMESRKLKAAAGCLREGIGETTAYLLPEFPTEHRRRIRTNNMIERLNREIRRRTRVVGSFPDGNSALMLICARTRYVTANEWSTRRYLDMSRLDDNLGAAA